MKKITIIGAGIGGLTTAIALKQQGFEVEIFETTVKFKKAGSGINLAINAMQIYKRLGIYEAILKAGNYTNTIKIRTKKLGLLTSTNLKKIEKKHNVKTVAIHRATLHKILVKHLENTEIKLNMRLKSLAQENGKVILNFEDGTSHIAEIVIGADGIHSNVRNSIFADTILRDAKQVCWRGISTVSIDANHREELNEIWGKGKRFGFVQITKHEVYWYALINKKDFKSKDVNLITIFSDYHQTVKDIITNTPKENILCNEIWDLKPIVNWHKGNVCLVGDAAHATTPNMGQGAVQAIESAMALSISLKEAKNAIDAFNRYQKIRKEKANYIVKTSWSIGKMAQSNNLIVCVLRDFIVKLIPKSVTEKQSKKMFELNF